MPESQAFAIATRQSHALGKSPRGYGTAAAKREARQKYNSPGMYKKTAAEKRTFSGLDIVVDRPRGFVQEGKDATGTPWRRVYSCDYGYIPGTKGGDGEDLDVFLGPTQGSTTAYLVTQRKDDGSFDEFKLLLGFPSRKDAISTYTKHVPYKYMAKVDDVSINLIRALMNVEPHVKMAGYLLRNIGKGKVRKLSAFPPNKSLAKVAGNALMGALEEGLPSIGSLAGAGIAAYNDKSPLSGSLMGAGIGAIPSLALKSPTALGATALGAAALGAAALPRVLPKDGDDAPTRARKAHVRAAMLDDGLPAVGAITGAALAGRYKLSKPGGVALGGALGAIPGLLGFGHDEPLKVAFVESQFSGGMGPGRIKYRAASAMPGGTLTAPLAKAAHMAFEAVGEWQTKTGARSPAQLLSAARRVGKQVADKATEGPSIAQMAKPVGFGRPIAGALKGGAP
jgi:hypothetical protein